MSRYVIHHGNLSNTLAVEQLHLNFVLYIALEKIRKENGQKRSSERFSVLSAKLTEILDCETSVWDIVVGYNLTRTTSRLLSRRFLQDFAIYNRAHFWGMI